jgi:hypothetical protein
VVVVVYVEGSAQITCRCRMVHGGKELPVQDL